MVWAEQKRANRDTVECTKYGTYSTGVQRLSGLHSTETVLATCGEVCAAKQEISALNSVSTMQGRINNESLASLCTMTIPGTMVVDEVKAQNKETGGKEIAGRGRGGRRRVGVSN